MDSQSYKPKNKTNYKDLLKPYLKQWKWFMLFLIIGFILGYLNIRYTTPKYAVNAKIQILQDQANSSELGAFRDLDLFNSGKTKVEDEIEIINSRSNLIEVVKELGLNVKILSKGKIHNTEIYSDPPFILKFLVPDSVVHKADQNFYINIVSDTKFTYLDEKNGPSKEYSFGSTITSSIGDFVIIPNDTRIERYFDKEFIIDIKPVVQVAQSYQSNIVIGVTKEFSNIVSISLNDAVVQKALDVLNAIIDKYNGNDIEDKRIIANKTAEFINERITDIYGDLSFVDQSAEEFKAGRGITDVASQSNLNLNIGAQSQQELQDANIQLNIAASMKDIVDSQQGYEVLPSNIGLADPSITNTTARYNELVLERNRLLKSSNEKNPIIVNLDQQLDGLKKNLRSSLNSTTNNLDLQVTNLSSQLSKINARIYAAPGNERALRDITRQQQTKEALYLYLLQKREESQIAYASSTPKSRVIDRAYSTSDNPVTPRKKITILTFTLLSMLLPFSYIYASELLDDKIHNMHTLEELASDIPVLGELPKLSKKDLKMVVKDDRSVLAESLRIIRTNLDYLLKGSSSSNKRRNVIFVTSSTPGEGKTFLSTNLAMIFASTQKKVLLIGADIRNPKFYTFFTGDQVDKLRRGSRGRGTGLTEYIFNENLQTNDIINSMLVHNNTIDVIYSGKIPPNPAEILLSDRIQTLIEDVSARYDYVVVDTAPLMVVTDTLLISKYADLLIYVTRAGVTHKNAIQYPSKLRADGKINNIAFVVNDVKESNLGYQGKYGYGYGMSKKKWWEL